MDKLHHVAIEVTDVQAALTWYQDQFEVQTGYVDDTWALLTFANVSLALVTPGQHPPHFAIERDDAETYGPLTPHRDGTASVYLEDPCGNAVEVLKTTKPDQQEERSVA